MAKAPQSTDPQDSAHSTVEQAAAKAHAAIDKAAGAAGSGEEKLHHMADEMRAQAEHIADTAKARSKELTDAVCEYTREHPVKTLGIAFLAGALVASLVRRK